MSGFDPTTPVTFTTRNILSAVWYIIIAAAMVIGSGALVVWAIVSFTIGGMRDDVGSIRESVQALQVADKSHATNLQDIENRIADRIAKLDNRLTDLSGKLDAVNAKLAAANASIEALSKSLEGGSGPGNERRRRR